MNDPKFKECEYCGKKLMLVEPLNFPASSKGVCSPRLDKEPSGDIYPKGLSQQAYLKIREHLDAHASQYNRGISTLDKRTLGDYLRSIRHNNYLPDSPYYSEDIPFERIKQLTLDPKPKTAGERKLIRNYKPVFAAEDRVVLADVSNSGKSYLGSRIEIRPGDSLVINLEN